MTGGGAGPTSEGEGTGRGGGFGEQMGEVFWDLVEGGEVGAVFGVAQVVGVAGEGGAGGWGYFAPSALEDVSYVILGRSARGDWGLRRGRGLGLRVPV